MEWANQVVQSVVDSKKCHAETDLLQNAGKATSALSETITPRVVKRGRVSCVWVNEYTWTGIGRNVTTFYVNVNWSLSLHKVGYKDRGYKIMTFLD